MRKDDEPVIAREKRGRGGRPSLSRSGEVDARILDAATRLFLERGFDGTSCDQVALDAHAGKASIYTRYANKDALFVAVVNDNLTRLLVATETVSAEQALTERLVAVGIRIVLAVVEPDTVALLRLVIAEAPRLPDIAASANQILCAGGVEQVAKAIAVRDPAAANKAMPAAAKFIDLVLHPYLMRALLGENLETLRAAAPQSVSDAVLMLTAAGWLDDWE